MATEILALLTAGWTGLTTALLLGTLLGFIVGLVPGLGGRVGIILCIPLATFWDSLGGAVFLFAMHAVVHTSASIPAIAFALPSSGADAATIIDGYPLAKMGRAGEAFGASLSASALGGVLGAVAFLACIPIARLLIVWFGPPEFLLLAIAGLTMVVFLSARASGRPSCGAARFPRRQRRPRRHDVVKPLHFRTAGTVVGTEPCRRARRNTGCAGDAGALVLR